MSDELKAQQVRGVFFPAHKRHTFHRINLEYLVPLQSLSPAAVCSLLDKGIRNNLRRAGSSDEIMPSLHPQLEALASSIAVQGVQLLQGKQQLRRQLLESSKHNFSAYRAGMGADFASKKLSESLLAPTAMNAQQQATLAEHLLRNALEADAHNYRAHFELGWMYLFVLNRLPEAVFHLEAATRQAQASDPVFAAFAQRHLADACYGLQQYGKAADLSLQLVHDSQQPDLEIRYEAARYLAADGENQAAAQQLAQIVGRSAVYYVQAQAEPDFAANAEVGHVLHDLRTIRVKRIQHYVDARWKQQPLANLPLPDQLDANVLFRDVCEQHDRVMSHLPYVTLSQREQQIGERILQASQKRIVREVQLRSRHYERVAEQERQRWSWVNQAGGVLIHVSTVLLLASLMFYLLRFTLDLLGIGNLLDADALVSHVLGGMFLLGITGITLFQFVPWGMKKLLRKQIELDNTLHILRSSS